MVKTRFNSPTLAMEYLFRDFSMCINLGMIDAGIEIAFASPVDSLMVRITAPRVCDKYTKITTDYKAALKLIENEYF